MAAAFEDRDLGALGPLVRERCTFVGDPGGRQLRRDEFLAGAEALFAAGTVSDWQVDGFTIDLRGDTAAATFAWSEHDGRGDTRTLRPAGSSCACGPQDSPAGSC